MPKDGSRTYKAPFEINYRELDNRELIEFHMRLHMLWNLLRQERVSSVMFDGAPRSPEDIINAHALTVQELSRRGGEHEPQPGDLDAMSKPFERETRPTIVEPSGINRGPEITANEILGKLGVQDLLLKPDMVLVYIKSGVPTIQIKTQSAELLDEFKKILVWRIKRAFHEIPGGAWRVQFSDGAIEAKAQGRAVNVDVRKSLRNIRVRHPYVSLVGGLAIHGKTVGDIDFLLKDPPEAVGQAQWAEVALQSSLGDLSDRAEFHSEMPYWGPFTDHFELYDLTFKVCEDGEIALQKNEGLYARVYDLVLERIPGNRRIEMSEKDLPMDLDPNRVEEVISQIHNAISRQEGRWPVMKLPDPAFTIKRLKDGKPAGFLSRVDRRSRIGVEQVLVNERKPGESGTSAFAIVKHGPGKAFVAFEDLDSELVAGLDVPSQEEFKAEKDFFYFPLDLVRKFDKPIALNPEAEGLKGRRFAGVIDLERDKLKAKQAPPSLEGEGTHEPHEKNGKHDHKGLPDSTGGHGHGPPDALGAHKHREEDEEEGWHLNIGSSWHIHNKAQGIEQVPSRELVIEAHFPAPKWIDGAVKTQIRIPGGEWKDTTETDWDDHAKTPLHNPEMNVEAHLDAFVRSERVLEKRYVMKDKSFLTPGRKEYESELEFFRKLTMVKDIVSHSRTKILNRKPTGSYWIKDGLMFSMPKPAKGKGGKYKIYVERQRGMGPAMEKAPEGATDASVIQEQNGKPEEVALEFMGRRVFVLQEVESTNDGFQHFRPIEVLLAIMDPLVTKGDDRTCHICKVKLTPNNSSGWEIFITPKDTVPICDRCNKGTNPEGQKVKQRSGGPQIQREAKASEREDRIMPDRFFVPQKPVLPVEPGQEQTVAALIDLVKKNDSFPVLVSKKFDGTRIITRKLGNRVEFWTEDGSEVTDRLPGIAEAVKKLKGETLVLDGELEWWEGGKHFPRAKVSGYLNSKSEPDDSNLVLNVFDLLYATGVSDLKGDIHKEAQIFRFASVAGDLGMPQRTSGVPNLKDKLNTVPHFEAMNEAELRRFIRQESGKPGSEGVVVKISDAPAQVRTDGNSEGAWIKWHKHLVITGLVAGKTETATKGVFVYTYGVDPGDIDPAEPLNVKGRKLAMMGKTFSTSQDLSVGDIVRVESENLTEIKQQDGKTEVNHFAPRVLDPADGMGLSDVPQLRRQAKRLGIYVGKEVLEDGTEVVKGNTFEVVIPEKDQSLLRGLPETGMGYQNCKVLLQDGREFQNVTVMNASVALMPVKCKTEDIESVRVLNHRASAEKQEDPYLIYPDEDKMYRFVWQHHYRGRTTHGDIRFENQDKEFLIGWTVSIQQAGKIKEPVDTVAKAETTDRRTEVFKYDPKTLKVKPRRTRAGVIIPANLQSFRKATQPVQWLNVEGKTGPFPAPGSTRNFPGVFTVQDRGKVEYGRQDPQFHEYFLTGGKFKGRILWRAIERRAENVSKAFHDILNEFDNEGEVLKILPPGDKPEGDEIREDLFWVMIQPVDQQPNVLDLESVRKGFRPPIGFSALPVSIRRQIPKVFRYWEATDGRTRNRRHDALLEALKRRDLDLNFDVLIKYDVSKQRRAKFTLQEQIFRGPIVVRPTPSTRKWWLRIDVGEPTLRTWEISTDPLRNPKIAGTFRREREKDRISLEGDIAPQSPLNPSKDTPSTITILDAGEARILEDTRDFLRIEFSGRKFKGVYVFQRESTDSRIFIISKARLPQTKELVHA